MADKAENVGQAPTVQPTGTNWLDEVKRDAEYLYLKRLREAKADAEYEASKQAASKK